MAVVPSDAYPSFPRRPKVLNTRLPPSDHALVIIATITMTTSLTIQESQADLEFLSKNNYNLQVAKAVSAPGGKPTFNVVYKSKSLAPNMTVSWSPTYGLNWATEIADPGAQVVYAGNWQACELGQSYDLTSVGEWVINNKDPNKDANSVNVGNNGYPQAVNIVVGILNPETQTWEAVCHQTSLPVWPGTSWLTVSFRSLSAKTSCRHRALGNTSLETSCNCGTRRGF